MLEMYNKTPEQRKELGAKALKNVKDRFSFDNYSSSWVKIVDDTIEKYGSWDNRRNYDRWTLKEIK